MLIHIIPTFLFTHIENVSLKNIIFSRVSIHRYVTRSFVSSSSRKNTHACALRCNRILHQLRKAECIGFSSSRQFRILQCACEPSVSECILRVKTKSVYRLSLFFDTFFLLLFLTHASKTCRSRPHIHTYHQDGLTMRIVYTRYCRVHSP